MGRAETRWRVDTRGEEECKRRDENERERESRLFIV